MEISRYSAPINASSIAPAQATSDEEVVRLWLHGRPANTQRAYLREVGRFFEFAKEPLQAVKLSHVQDFADSLGEMKSSSVTRSLAAIKSLMSFAHEIGYTQFNVGLPVRLPTVRNRRAERILTEEQVMKMLALTKNPRDHALLRLAYASALRISELASLSWRDLAPRGDSGQVSVMAKGGKNHTVLLSSGTWNELKALRIQDSLDDSPVFVSRKGNRLSPVQIHRIVVAASQRSEIPAKSISALAQTRPCQPCAR